MASVPPRNALLQTEHHKSISTKHNLKYTCTTTKKWLYQHLTERAGQDTNSPHMTKNKCDIHKLFFAKCSKNEEIYRQVDSKTAWLGSFLTAHQQYMQDISANHGNSSIVTISECYALRLIVHIRLIISWHAHLIQSRVKWWSKRGLRILLRKIK